MSWRRSVLVMVITASVVTGTMLPVAAVGVPTTSGDDSATSKPVFAPPDDTVGSYRSSLSASVSTDTTYDLQAAVDDSATGETPLTTVASVAVRDTTSQPDRSSVVLNRTLGRNGNRLNSITNTSDGGLAVAGETFSFDTDFDAWVVQLAPNGTVLINRTVGSGNADIAESLVETNDGSLVFAGETRSFGSGKEDAWVVQLAPNGSVVMNRTFGGSETDWANSLIETSDGGLAFAGETASFGSGGGDAWVVKLTHNGTVIMNRTFGGSNYDEATSLVETSDGGLAVAGETASFGSGRSDAWVVKLAPNGSVVMNRTFGGSGDDRVSSLVETSDGGLAFTGTTQSFGSGGKDAWVVKLAPNGTVVLNRLFNGSGRDSPSSLVEMEDDGLVFAGETTSFGSGKDDAWVVKLAPDGTVVLNRTFGGSDPDSASSLVATGNDSLAFAGFATSFWSDRNNAWVVKIGNVPGDQQGPQATLGDVNTDGSINTGDVIQVQRSIVGLSTVSGFSTQAADVNTDGNVNTGDVIQIQRFIVGLSSVLD